VSTGERMDVEEGRDFVGLKEVWSVFVCAM